MDIHLSHLLSFLLPFPEISDKNLFQNNNNKHAHELWTDGHVDALILYSLDYMSQTEEDSRAILLLRLVKYNDISVLSGFFSVCGWEQAPWHLWCTLSCWLAQAIWLMGNRATGTDFHSCSRWCQCAAKPSTHRFSLNGRSEVVCVRSGTLHLHACSASTNSHT